MTVGYFSRWRFFGDHDLTLANFIDRVYALHEPEERPVSLTRPLPHRRLSSARALSYRQLFDFVNRLGNVLRDKAGMKRYDRVAICKSDAPDYFIMALAIIRAGGIAVPINGGMPLQELREYLALTGSRLLITDRETYAATIRSPAALPLVETWLFPEAPEQFQAPHVQLNEAMEEVADRLDPVPMCADSDVLIVHTSGTTGTPKGVLHTSGTTLRTLRVLTLNLPGSSRHRRQIYAWPNSHLIAHHTSLLALLAGYPTFYVRGASGEEVLELMEREKITEYGGFPDTYLRLHEASLDRYRLDSMRFWFSAADAAHEVHIRSFTQKGALFRLWGRPLIRSVFVETLGSSEINGPAVLRFIFSFSRSFGRYTGRRFPLGPQVKVADQNGQELPPGEVGRLMVKSPSLFKGYWNAHDRLHGVFFDGWWATGDVAYCNRWGRFYQMDRATDVIATESGPLYSLPVEEELLKHPAVSEAVVFGVPQPSGYQAPVALVSPRCGSELDAGECLEWVQGRLGSGFLTAVHVVPLEEIRRGLTGKVLKRELRHQFAARVPEGEKLAT